VRVIAGEYAGSKGPASTFSALNVWDVRLKAGRCVSLTLPEGHIAAIAVLRGSLCVNGSRPVGDAELLVLDRAGEQIEFAAAGDATLLLLSGEPIGEPIVGYGPFVMNSRQEIETAIADFQRGKFGRMPAGAATKELA
jgi:redox-sensitive bicupin YhaK (pirin superfamily)